MTDSFLVRIYDAYGRIEEELRAALDESLEPSGPESLYDYVAVLAPLPDRAVDVGSGEGRHTIELARRFAISVLGVDPVARHIELSNAPTARGRCGYRTRRQSGF